MSSAGAGSGGAAVGEAVTSAAGFSAAARAHLGQTLLAGAWADGAGAVVRRLVNPADTDEVVAEVRESSLAQVDAACDAARVAFKKWRITPPPERAHVMFKFRELLEANAGDLAAMIVRENGKLLSEAKGDVRRGIDVVEFACGIPTLLLGRMLPEVSHNVDTYYIREPIGVMAGIPPFNFPAMIPLWMMPVAIACGNCFVLKPAEKAPLTATRICELLAEALGACGAPPGVISVVQGGREVSEHLIRHEAVKGVSFVGSSPVAEAVFRLGGELGKRVMALGGAKNHMLVLEDADVSRAMPALLGSCFGCAGQRCLAGSVVIAVGDKARQDAVVDAFVAGARALKLGAGFDPSATLCPVNAPESRARVLGWIDKGVAEGAKLVLDGRGASAPECPRGCFVGATVFDCVDPETMSIGREEVFGPVVTVLRAASLDEAITIANRAKFGNSASIFTTNGAAVRTFRSRIQCGMLGINAGVPAPMALFSFRGWKASAFGVTGAHGSDAVDFATHKKVVTERWFGAEAPKDGWV